MQWYIAGFVSESAQGTIHRVLAMPLENQQTTNQARRNLIISVFRN
jgi:hypothetical protein